MFAKHRVTLEVSPICPARQVLIVPESLQESLYHREHVLGPHQRL